MDLNSIDPSQVLVITGHRDLKYSQQQYLKERLNVVLPVALEQGYKYFISGMALGTDQIGLSIAIEHGFIPIAAVPFPGQASNWSQMQKEYYYLHLLQQVKDKGLVVYVHDINPLTSRQATQMLMKRNEWMVNLAISDNRKGKVISCLDVNKQSGGTLACVKYAIRNELEVYNIDPAKQQSYYLSSQTFTK